jgi:KDO2-lipid IV(A) lauroyltransferase
MKNIKYFIQFCLTILSFLVFKILGPNLSSKLSGKIFEIIGPFFRSRQIIHSNIKRGIPDINSEKLENMTSLM